MPSTPYNDVAKWLGNESFKMITPNGKRLVQKTSSCKRIRVESKLSFKRNDFAYASRAGFLKLT